MPSEARRFCSTSLGYRVSAGDGVIYGNNQGKLAKPLTTLTVDEVIAADPRWTKNIGSLRLGCIRSRTRPSKDSKRNSACAARKSSTRTCKIASASTWYRARASHSPQINAGEFGKRPARERRSTSRLGAHLRWPGQD